MLPRIHFTIERWRKNEHYGVYVSTLGRVKLIKNKQLLEPRFGTSGYAFVFTEKGAMRVHRLVAMTWIGDLSATCTVDHINSNTRDNSLKNLRWIPFEVNQNYAKYTKINGDLEQEVYKKEGEKELPVTVSCKAIDDLLNDSIELQERLTKFVALLNAGEIFIKCRTTIIHTLDELQETKRKFAGQSTDDSFYTKILNVANNKNKVYCGVQWKIQAVKEC